MYVILSMISLASSAMEPVQLSDIVSRLAGVGAHACGVAPLGSDATASMDCAKESISSGRSFWVAIQLQGEDSYVWRAAAQSNDGKRWVVQFDSDIGGEASPAPKPLFEVIPCDEMRISSRDRNGIMCASDRRPRSSR